MLPLLLANKFSTPSGRKSPK